MLFFAKISVYRDIVDVVHQNIKSWCCNLMKKCTFLIEFTKKILQRTLHWTSRTPPHFRYTHKRIFTFIPKENEYAVKVLKLNFLYLPVNLEEFPFEESFSSIEEIFTRSAYMVLSCILSLLWAGHLHANASFAPPSPPPPKSCNF